jgi:GAG-pre-integrase domain
MITIQKDDFKIDFDVRIKTAKGVLYGVKIKSQNKFCGAASERISQKMTVMEAHYKLGHLGMQAVKNVADSLGWRLTGKEAVCELCAEGKAWQRNIMVKDKNLTKH